MLRTACVRALAGARSASLTSTSSKGVACGFVLDLRKATLAYDAARQAQAAPPDLRQLLGAYKDLSKFRLSVFVVSTACAGFALGSGEEIDWQKMAWTAFGTFGASAAANTLNQVYEIDKDRLMKRTMRRPLPSGLLSPRHALLFAAASAAAGVGALHAHANGTAALLGAANIALYAGVYTPLKQVSVANTWVGAVVGAVPPLMGWAAAAGHLDPGAGVLAALLYFWQLPHFMALAFLYRADYAAGGYRMLPIIDETGRRVAAVALRNSLYLLPLGAAACALGVCSPPFALESAAASGALALGAALFRLHPTQGSARRLFLLSLAHLPVVQALAVAHRVPNTEELRSFAAADSLSAYASRVRAALATDPSPSVDEVVPARAAANSGGFPPLVVPFPFLPLPGTCPSRTACDAGSGGAGEASASGRGGAGGAGAGEGNSSQQQQRGALFVFSRSEEAAAGVGEPAGDSSRSSSWWGRFRGRGGRGGPEQQPPSLPAAS